MRRLSRRRTARLSRQHSISPGAPLHRARITSDEDLIRLRRQVRDAAAYAGLDDERRSRSLAASTFDAAGLLLSEAGTTEVTVSLGPPGDLKVVLSVARGVTSDLPARLEAALEVLRVGVDHLSFAATDDGFSVRLAVHLSARTPVDISPSDPDGDRANGMVSLSRHDALIEENARLRRSLLQLQSEMQETNRGVVALYAEVDDQAERLRQAEERLRVLLDSVHDYAICMLGPDGTVVSWNAGAERVFGYASGDILQQNAACFYIAPERDAALAAEHLRLAAEYGRLEFEAIRVRRGGATFEALVLLTAMRGAGGVLRGFSMVVRDITERKRLENDLRRRADELAAANRAKEEFLATLSHELRTPLNAMLGWTRLLRLGKLDPAGMDRALETIERNAHMQEQLIADILDVSRIVTGKLRIDLRPIDLEPIVQAAMDTLRPAADAKGIHLMSDVARSGTVMGDPDRLQQVIWNLLANAIKFTGPGGQVTASLDRSGPHAEIKVTDTGQGIPPELLPYVFDRFTQGDTSVTRPHGGLGLGLSIVRHIVELHGGQVSAASDGNDRGATFSVLLPIRAVRSASQPAGAGDHPLSGVRVLVVDDDKNARDVVSMTLASCGARTRAAGSAREALQALGEFRPDVLISDLSMPGEDGYSLIRRVRALGGPGLADVPAVALTGLSDVDERRRALLAGFQQFMPKPVEADALAGMVKSLAHSKR